MSANDLFLDVGNPSRKYRYQSLKLVSRLNVPKCCEQEQICSMDSNWSRSNFRKQHFGSGSVAKDSRFCCCKLTCPLLVLWSARDDLEVLHGDILSIWRSWASNVRGRSIDCGHHMAEEAPEELAAELGAFFQTS